MNATESLSPFQDKIRCDPDALCENAQSFEHAMASPMNLRIFELGHIIKYDGSGDPLHRSPS
jgi:hypothetical protein